MKQVWSLVFALLAATVVPGPVQAFVGPPCTRTSSSRSTVIRHATTSSTVTKTEEEWREALTPEQYFVLREEGTEAANASELNVVKEPGTFLCAGCGTPLFTTFTKFNSGTGWPSFYAPVDNVVINLSTDFKAIFPRTECSCGNCGGHLGHVFDDGPDPTGQRFCMNGVAMKFVANAEAPELSAMVMKKQLENPYSLAFSQILPGVMVNGILGGLFFNAFLARLQTIGLSSPIEAFPLLPALYFGTLAVKACSRLSPAALPFEE